MKRPRGRPPTNPIKIVIYLFEVLFLNPWILLGIIGGIIAYKLINTPEGVIFGIVFGLIFGYKLLRG